jgi:NAD+ synthase
MLTRKPFTRDIILLENIEAVSANIIEQMREDVLQRFRRNGAVVGISGGIDSSVCFALTVRAFGPDKVLGVMLPEKDSSPDSEMLARALAAKFGAKAVKEEITGALAGFGCYMKRDEAVKRVFPEYDPAKWTMKIGSGKAGSSVTCHPFFISQ